MSSMGREDCIWKACEISCEAETGRLILTPVKQYIDISVPIRMSGCCSISRCMYMVSSTSELANLI